MLKKKFYFSSNKTSNHISFKSIEMFLKQNDIKAKGTENSY